MIAAMTPEQRSKLQSLMPMAQQMANKYGINFQTVATEINNLQQKG